ncbi:hypothetical protein DFH11DRAFT_1215894 [Phellopilus nigrolimitatus]|nr:hypothetical protein DFH11DRAFT_1215894 [Phellopilus nigrolimitatus]
MLFFDGRSISEQYHSTYPNPESGSRFFFFLDYLILSFNKETVSRAEQHSIYMYLLSWSIISSPHLHIRRECYHNAYIFNLQPFNAAFQCAHRSFHRPAGLRVLKKSSDACLPHATASPFASSRSSQAARRTGRASPRLRRVVCVFWGGYAPHYGPCFAGDAVAETRVRALAGAAATADGCGRAIPGLCPLFMAPERPVAFCFVSSFRIEKMVA